MKYQGKFKPKYPQKYIGDFTNIVYRSGWELAVMFFCDKNENIIKWSSEEIRIPYICPLDNKRHIYFVDFFIQFKDQILLVEVKPKKFLNNPIIGKTKKHLKEMCLFAKNQAKFKAATKYAQKKNWNFVIWTEETLKQLGIKIF